MKLHIITTGGTIDKIYFDAKSDYQVGDPVIGELLERMAVGFAFSVESAMRRDSLDMTDADYGWTAEMQLKASKLGVPLMQLPVRYRQRIGKSKISGTLKGTLMAGYKIFYWTFRLFTLNRKISHFH